ncbi:alpha/beta hydrolase-fold protein [Parapedobacter defluvii]|uniref:alpha/beta hydrolase n=1 Tax=Parapedobacter defluvii TaxID=2045106 RepID=UPI003340EDA4
MKNNTLLVWLLLLPALGTAQLNQPINYLTTTREYHSATVGDTFTVAMQLPKDYYSDTTQRYPIVLLVDGDFYFPSMAPLIRQYEMTGLLPPLILVGIGYGDFQKMDSLRVRDFLYPKPLESDEITAPGGGLNFYRFITTELLPQVEMEIRVDTTQRTLLGHSFGGYFALAALLQQVKEDQNIFSNIVAASPSLWYHDFYLDRLPDELALHKPDSRLNMVLTAGSLENSEWTLNPIYKLTVAFKNQDIQHVYLNAFIYNFLDHMDTGQLSFIKGLQSFFNQPPTQ